MTFPNTPPEGINPIEGLDAGQIALLLLASIAFEELGLAHVINAEAEKLQGAIGTLVDENGDPINPLIQAGSLAELLEVNREVEKVLRTVIKKEMLLEFKFENVLDLIATITPTVTLNADLTTICAFDTGPNESVLSGQVLVNGSPPPAGTPVFFTVNNPVLGTVAPNPAFTDALGNFTATFTAIDGFGPVMITATALGGISSPVTITIVDCNEIGFSVSISSTQVCAFGTGPNTATVSGTVFLGGVPIGGIPVLFSVTNPALATVAPNPAFTDASGNYTATFTAIDGTGTIDLTTTVLGRPLTLTGINIVACD
ncbi:hypothetical protein [Peribacillus butanolivorans]|uniref:hypothetical protein n=1 Tax=Peribacillus butanolivorans TaxID=421767 RepID=UPI0036566DF8